MLDLRMPPALDLAARTVSADGAPADAPTVKPSLAGLDRAGLVAAMAAAGVPAGEQKMRANQIYHWLYVRGARSFDAMTNVSNRLRLLLAEHHTLERPQIVTEQVSADGTRKWLMRMPPAGPHDRGAEIETVYIPDDSRGTLCISSQVGCTLTCTFCHTGTQKLVRNLTAAEIVAQLLVARDRLGDWPGETPPEGAVVPRGGGRFVSNVVMMGMGEPLYNVDNVLAALKVMSDPDGLCLSRRRITLSTSGVVPMIGVVGEAVAPALAISLHATNDALRDTLVPLNRKYPIRQLLDACRNYPGLSNARRITFEYVMLKGVNDSLDEARALVRLLKGIPAKINLIPFNPWPGSAYECSEWEQIEAFSEVIFRAGYASPIRTPRGRDILAACGQLKSESQKMRASERIAIEKEAMTKLAVEAFYAHGVDET
jgi:23S rRNA (adenine2503-C2)-methyltransferase